MKKCIIFCAAEFDKLIEPISPGDYVIAADGGLAHCEKAGITPNEILGDFDSLGFVPEGANVFPVEKDDTDAMLAVRRGLSLGFREFVLYGSLDGRRLDHTVANYQTLHFLCDHGARGTLVGRDFLVTAVQNGSISFPAGKSGTISVFCLGPDAKGVSLKGLYYPLEDATLRSGFPLGVSNHFTGAPARVEVKDGTLLVMWERSKASPLGEAGTAKP